MRAINKKQLAGLELAFSEWCSINSYKGWLMHCDSYRLEDKYIGPIREFTENFYLKNIKGKEKRYHERI
jgi:hypothetical protein